MNAGRIAPLALYQEVAERLRQRIFAHELPPGTWVDEQALAAQYGISRTPLREALKVLAAEGLVTLKPRRGCYVTEISERDLDEIFTVMALLEGQCAADTARKASETDLIHLRSVHDELERAAGSNDIDGFFEANQAFHQEVQHIADNRWLTQAITDLRKVIKLPEDLFFGVGVTTSIFVFEAGVGQDGKEFFAFTFAQTPRKTPLQTRQHR